MTRLLGRSRDGSSWKWPTLKLNKPPLSIRILDGTDKKPAFQL